MSSELENEKTQPDFLETIKRRVVKDIQNAEDFLSNYRDWCKDMHSAYHASEKFVDLRKKNKMPSTLITEHVDQFRADATDKLWYNGRPCRIVGREEADKLDAEAKQMFMDYQDIEDGIFQKFGLWLRDAPLYKCAVAQVDYKEKTKREWVVRDVPLPALDEFGTPMIGDTGELVPATDPMTGMMMPSGQQYWELEEVVVYRGATAKRIDPSNLLITVDKSENFDEWPIMVRSFQSKDFFESENYFFNQDILASREQQGVARSIEAEKKGLTNTGAERTDKPYEYIEWQGLVDKAALYNYLYQGDPSYMAKVNPNEKCLTVVGIVDKETVVRVSDDPLKWGRPNIVIGYIDPEEDSPFGRAISQMIECYYSAQEDLNGIQLENFKQSVNAMWVINKAALVDKKPIINAAGKTLLTNDDPNKVARRIDQPRVAPDIYLMNEQYTQSAQNASGMQDTVAGRGERGVETLGEATQVLAQAGLKLRSYIRHFEDSFIVPLYALRNHINATFIDQEHAFRIIGDKAGAWRTITPEQMRAPVDFICESAARETQRAVIVQQMLQFIQMAPLAAQLGQPVRLDKIMAKLAENGFGWSIEEIDEYFPLIAMERLQGKGMVDQMLVQNAMLQMQMPQLQMAMGMAGMGKEQPQPKSEGQAINSANKRNQPQLSEVR